METEGSLPCSQKHVTNLYPEPDESNPQPATVSPNATVIFSFILWSSKCLFPSGFPTKILYAFLKSDVILSDNTVKCT